MATFEINRGLQVIVDDDDLARVRLHVWHGEKRKRTHYARAWIEGSRRQYLHQFIAGHQHVDHANGNGLDNRRANLRRCTPSQNQANRHAVLSKSGFKGVSWDKRRRKWVAELTVNYRRRNLGAFESAIEAARVYDAELTAVHGEFACTNAAMGLLTD